MASMSLDLPELELHTTAIVIAQGRGSEVGLERWRHFQFVFLHLHSVLSIKFLHINPFCFISERKVLAFDLHLYVVAERGNYLDPNLFPNEHAHIHKSSLERTERPDPCEIFFSLTFSIDRFIVQSSAP